MSITNLDETLTTPGEATREFYREQGRQQERQRMTETEAIRENYNLGVLAGEAREQQRIIKLLEPHRPTGKSVSGFLGVCSCGEAIDDYQEHLIALIKGQNK